MTRMSPLAFTARSGRVRVCLGVVAPALVGHDIAGAAVLRAHLLEGPRPPFRPGRRPLRSRTTRVMPSACYDVDMPVGESGFSFDAGRLSLDFLATLSNRGSASAVERFGDCESLRAWLAAAELGPLEGAIGLSDLLAARRLREAIFAIVHAAMTATVPSAEELRAVNRAAEPAPPSASLVFEHGRVGAQRRSLTLGEALSVVARDAIDLVATGEVSLLRECEAHDCTGLYVDASRGRRRRWCSAARCGNRARVSAHRARARRLQPDG